MEPSIFTKIIEGEIPCHKIYEDDNCIAFLDINPLREGHTLVVPKQQIDLIWDLPEETYQNLWRVTSKIAKNLQTALNPERVTVRVEGFDVPHTHIHLIPASGSLAGATQNPDHQPDHDALAKIAAKITAQFNKN